MAGTFFKSKTLEIVQIQDSAEGRAFVGVKNPNNDPNGITIDKLLTEQDLKAFYDHVTAHPIHGAEFVLGGFNLHSEDNVNDDTGYHHKTPHFHADFLFSKPVAVNVLANEFQQVTGKVLPTSCISGSTDKSNAPSEKKIYGMMAYLVHAFKDGSGRPAPQSAQDPDFSKGYYFDGTDFQPLDDATRVNGSVSSFAMFNHHYKGCDFLYPLDAPTVYNCTMSDMIAKFVEYREEMSAQSKKRQQDLEVAEFLGKVASGEIRPYEVYNACSPAVYIEACDKSKLKHAIDYAFHHMPEGFTANRNLQVIHIQGASGSGKTVMAKQICEKLGYSYIVSTPGAHPFDEYNGQDCLILDDFRDCDIQFSQFLKILDNNTISDLPARYYNRSTRFLKMIIITSVHPVGSLYAKRKDASGEEKKQLFRRITTSIKICDQIGELHYFSYNKATGSHAYVSKEAYVFDAETAFADAPKDAVSLDQIRDCLHGMFTAPLCDPDTGIPTGEELDLSEIIFEDSLVCQIENIFPPYKLEPYINAPIKGLFIPASVPEFHVSPEGRPWITPEQ